MIRALLFFWLAWQIASPQAAEHMQAGIAAEKERKFDVAVAEFKKVTELDPAFPEGFISLGQAYMESGDYGSAIPPLKHALDLGSDSAPAHQLLGYALLAQGFFSDAIPHLQRSPDKTALGIAQIQTGQLSEAVDQSAGCPRGASERFRYSLLSWPRQRSTRQAIHRYFAGRLS